MMMMAPYTLSNTSLYLPLVKKNHDMREGTHNICRLGLEQKFPQRQQEDFG